MNSLRRQTVTGLLLAGYKALTSVAAPMAAPVFLVSKRGRSRLAERYGLWGDIGEIDWWFHGASVGEVQGLLPIMSKLRERHKGVRILLTTTSVTGLERGESAVDEARLLPLDAPWCIRKALSTCLPKRFVACETELWPALLSFLLGSRVPCAIVNGRISDYTIRRYKFLSGIFEPLLSEMRRICVPGVEQRERFAAVGAVSETISVTGHTKYDVVPKEFGKEDRRLLRERFFPGIDEATRIIVLGSVRPGEETAWLDALNTTKSSNCTVKIVLVPRHAEKFAYFSHVLEERGLRWAKWTREDTNARDVFLLDAMGQLEAAYSVADLAFIGATLVDIGGHNPFEAAMYEAPICVGPHIHNIRDEIAHLRARNAVVEISEDSIVGLVGRLAHGDESLAGIGRNGFEVWSEHRGATGRVLDLLEGAFGDVV